MPNKVMFNASEPGTGGCGQDQVVLLSMIDICTLLVGQPVIVRLLWIVLTSKKTIDILNFNLALFLNLEYFMLFLHLNMLFLLPTGQATMLKFLLAYAQVGGPMSLSFICMERYVAVIHPTSYPLLKKYRYREVCAAAVWLFSVPSAFANVFADKPECPILETLLRMNPLLIMTVTTAVIVRSSISVAKALKHSGPGKDVMHPVKKRAFKTVCATLIIIMLFYIPVSLMQRIGYLKESFHMCSVTSTCIFLLSAASVVHPVFYLSTQGKLFPCLK